ncbi:MAG: acyl-CoA dehydrogenase family protein, partial [Caldilineaceae bacterium]|nr:acyl-CoA dehydrogenase family protein [Caldilineaceae bacterium]
MSIAFKTPELIEKQLRPVQVIAEHVMRPDSRQLDDQEHTRPVKFIEMIWPQMRAMELANLEASLRRAQRNGHEPTPVAAAHGNEAKGGADLANLLLIHMIEMLSWGDAGIYLCIPASALAGAAINAVGTPEQLERFLR